MNAQEIRNSIIQFAIEGKLINPLPNATSVSVTLEMIYEEKNKLVNEKYIKKEKSLPVIKEEEIPFDLPPHWQWERLNNVCVYIQRGKSPAYSDIKEIPVVSQKCVQWKGFTLDPAKFIDPESTIKYEKVRYLVSGDLLWNSTGLGTVGRVAIYDKDLNPYSTAVADSHVTIVRCSNHINHKFIYYYLSSGFIQLQMMKLTSGSTKQKELNTSTIKSLPVPLPPLEEQNKIVEKIESLLLNVDLYEEFYNSLEKLQDQFPKDLEKSILHYAIQGKLVNQDTSDEPASKLLKQISEQKEQMVKEKIIKKEKSLPPITEEEIPFDIPDTWEWARLGNLVLRNIGGGTPSKSIPEYWNGSIPWASVKDLKSNIIDSTQDTITELGLEKSSSNLIEKGNLIVCTRMGLGKIAINQMPIAINQDLRALYLPDQLEKEYVIYYFNTLTLTGKGATVKGINLTELNSLLIPVPPLNEQRRIVSKIKKMFLQTEKILSL